MKLKVNKKYKAKPEPRKHKVSIMLNDSEMRALERYCNQYVVSNRSKLIRETLMRNILKRFDTDSPTLFDFEND
jgi:metal-responsive CopG/Arc/MetJ family transcriptional regulator